MKPEKSNAEYLVFYFSYMAKKKEIDYLETFVFPGIPDILYPVYAISESGKIMNFKAISYPNPRSRKKFTRRKQLLCRSLQAKIFDAIIQIGYFNPLTVYTEFPVVIQNSLRLPGQEGLYYYLDYYFPEIHVAVELDSDLHKPEKDKIRDEYLGRLGITVFRMTDFQKPSVQGSKFHELTKLLREKGVQEPIQFRFQEDIRSYAAQNLNNGKKNNK
jgi:hypothetical protein